MEESIISKSQKWIMNTLYKNNFPVYIIHDISHQFVIRLIQSQIVHTCIII